MSCIKGISEKLLQGKYQSYFFSGALVPHWAQDLLDIIILQLKHSHYEMFPNSALALDECSFFIISFLFMIHHIY